MKRILLAPNLDLALRYSGAAEATVEAEYGDLCVTGTKITMAHHGSRANNPAPCNDLRADDVVLSDDAVILVSHLDLDTVGGIMKLQGDWSFNDAEFWRAAEFIDVNGPQHIHELPEYIQDQLNAIYAWEQEHREKIDHENVTDVTAQVSEYTAAIDLALDINEPNHEAFIQAGRDWNEKVTQEIESKLVQENEFIRVFESDGPFCNGSYYSPNQDKIVPAIVTHNTKTGAITLSFADGGQNLSAREIMRELFGPEAGGRDGIAGTPRGVEYSLEDANKVAKYIEMDRDCEIIANISLILANQDKLPENIGTEIDDEDWSNKEYDINGHHIKYIHYDGGAKLTIDGCIIYNEIDGGGYEKNKVPIEMNIKPDVLREMIQDALLRDEPVTVNHCCEVYMNAVNKDDKFNVRISVDYHTNEGTKYAFFDSMEEYEKFEKVANVTDMEIESNDPDIATFVITKDDVTHLEDFTADELEEDGFDPADED